MCVSVTSKGVNFDAIMGLTLTGVTRDTNTVIRKQDLYTVLMTP